MKQTTLFALAAASSFACVSASAAIQAFNDDCSEVGVRWSDQTGDYVTSDGSKVTVDTDTTTEVSYYTTYDGTASGTKVVTVLDFDVTFTAATSRPDWQEGAQFQLYVSSSGNVMAMVNDTSSNDVDLGVTNAGLTHVTITKSGNSFSVKVGNNTAATVSPASGSASELTSVGFLGTGTVDNFVGSYGSTATNEGSSDTTSGSALVSGNTVTGSFATTVNNNALKFIKVTTSKGTYTLRYKDGQRIALPSDAGTVQSVVAYYGDNVTAIPAEYAPAVDQVADDSGKVGVSVVAESGVYYSLKAGDKVVAKELVAPADQGKKISLTFNPAAFASKTDWGKTTITFQATDDDPGTVVAGE